MYKLLTLLILSSLTYAECDFTFDLKLKDKRMAHFQDRIEKEALEHLEAQNFRVVNISSKSIVIEIDSDQNLNRFNVQAFTEVRHRGVLRNYSYGEGIRSRSQRRSFRLNNIVLALKKSLNQLSECLDDK